MAQKKKAVCFVVGAESFVEGFLSKQLEVLALYYDISLIAPTDSPEALKNIGISADIIHVPIARNISLKSDVFALIKLSCIFRNKRFDVIHSMMPKAGFLAMLAGWLARVPVRIHTFTGQVWITRTGLMCHLLKNCDRVLSFCATDLLSDSPSQVQILNNYKITQRPIKVLGHGSNGGVDVERFCADTSIRKTFRSKIGVGDTEVLILFVGRLNRDKGVLDLVQAFVNLSNKHQGIHLAIVGPDEEDLKIQIDCAMKDNSCIHYFPETACPEHYMMAADIFCLPSYRESFGLVTIEAAAVGLPVVASDIYGITDAVKSGDTALLYSPGDIDGLESQLAKLVVDSNLRTTMGQAGKRWVHKYFQQDAYLKVLVDYYGETVGSIR